MIADRIVFSALLDSCGIRNILFSRFLSFVNIEYGNDSSEDEFDFSLSNDEIISICKEIGDRENESSYENRDEVRGYVNSS